MALSNRDRIGRVMDALREGLGPFVIREYKMVYKGSGYIQAIDRNLRTQAYQLPDEAMQEEIEVLRDMRLSEILAVNSFVGLGFEDLDDALGDVTVDNQVLADDGVTVEMARVTVSVSWTSSLNRALTKSMSTLVTKGGINRK